MKNIKLLFAMFVLSSVAFTSCNKDEDEEATPSKSELVVGTWTMTAAKIDPPIDFFGTQISDIYNTLMPDCSKDDLFVFESDKSYEFNEGSSKCDANDPHIIETGSWKWNTDQTILITTDSQGNVEETNVKSISSSTMVFTESETDSTTSVTYTTTITMTKQ